MRYYAYKGYILQLSKSIQPSSLKIFLDSSDPEPQHILRVEGKEIAKIYYIDERFGIVSGKNETYGLIFNKDWILKKNITVNYSVKLKAN